MFLSSTEETDPRRVHRSMSGRRKLLYTVIVGLMTLVVIELGLQFLYFVREQIPPFYQRALRISPYADLDWPKEYFAEERATKNQFVPYLMWRRQEFHGRHINISADGVRKTWNPPTAAGRHLQKVFLFGGSTTWGVGARDNFTIPSLLSKKLNQTTPGYLVENYGEKGYCLTQEIMYLVLLLKQGNIPDYVIFYDGINEVMVGYKNMKPGSIFGANYIRKQLYQKETVGQSLRKVWRQSGLYRGYKDLSDLVKPHFRKERVLTPEEKQALGRLADDIVADYLRNIELVKQLAQAYDFQYLFIWQPALLTNQALTTEEKKLPAWTNKKMVKLYQLVYERMARVKMAHFYNIATMFDRKKGTLFFSWAHITEAGNKQVADRLYHIFQQEFPSKIATPPKESQDRS
jgi:lysophospholipase L1-like esterase